MSTEAVKQVIGRAIVEIDYRELLFQETDQALEGYELTEEEIGMLKSIHRENFDAVATELTERISRMGLGLIEEKFDGAGTSEKRWLPANFRL